MAAVFLLTVLFEISYLLCDPIKQWDSYSNLPKGFSGAMASYNSTTRNIAIISPNAPYGKVYYDYSLNKETFISHKYPQDDVIELPITNDYVAIDDLIYFVDIFPGSYLGAFSTTNGRFTNLKWNLPNTADGSYQEVPCLTKTNDNKYIFILGGVQYSSNQYIDTFMIYDVINNKLFGYGPALPFAASRFGCIVSNDDHLYIIGGIYMKNTSHIEQKTNSNKIWSLYVNDINNMNASKWVEMNSTLPYKPQYPFIGEVDELIYVIGGYDPDNDSCSKETNYLIYQNGESTNPLSPGPLLPTPLCYAAGIAANYEIFLFGGQDSMNNNAHKPQTWMKSNYAGPPTMQPTFPTLSPTHSPSDSPTSPTDAPTQSPTNSPTHSPTAPTQSPTQSPTHSPSDSPTAPTNSPTQSPTFSPSFSPTRAPTVSSPAKKEHTNEYWEFMIISISVSAIIICGVFGWLYKRWRDAKRNRFAFVHDR